MEIQAQEQRKSTCTRHFSGKGHFRPSEEFTSAVTSGSESAESIGDGRTDGFLSTALRKPRQPLLQHDLCPTDICHLPTISSSAVDRSFNHHAVWRAICFISTLEMLT